MLKAFLGGNNLTVDINSQRSLFAIIFLSVIGPCVFIVQPGYIQGLVEYLGFSEPLAAQVASWEMWGIAVSTLILIAIAGSVSWRQLMVVFVLLCAVGNFLSIGQTDYDTLKWLRFLTGLGSGGIISLTFTMAGLTARADRNFAAIIVAVLTYGAIVMWAMPMLYQTIGMRGLLIFWGIFCLSGLFVIRDLPDSGAAHANHSKSYDYNQLLRYLTLIAILVFNIGIGIVWAYLFLVGLETGMPEQGVANVLMISQLFGIAGALFVVFNETRFGRLWPLLLGIIGIAVSIYLLLGDVSRRDFWLAVCGFNLLWNLVMPYTLSTAGDFDAQGRTVVYAIAMQMVGLAVGPYLAAKFFETGGFDAVNISAVAAFLIAVVLFIPGVLAQKSQVAESRQ